VAFAARRAPVIDRLVIRICEHERRSRSENRLTRESRSSSLNIRPLDIAQRLRRHGLEAEQFGDTQDRQVRAFRHARQSRKRQGASLCAMVQVKPAPPPSMERLQNGLLSVETGKSGTTD
jgi:hypothetical protein